MFFRKRIEETFTTPIGNWKGAPVNTRIVYYSSFHMLDISKNVSTVPVEIEAGQFYRALDIFKKNGGISKVDEEYLYDKVLENDFVMFCLAKSDYM
jgi:hypothetical protein